MRSDFKKDLKATVSKVVSRYDDFAGIPKLAAGKMAASLEPWLDLVPGGPILEVGCGTGLVTERLLPLFPGREIIVSDISPEMVESCKKNIVEKGLLRDGIRFEVLDAEKINDIEKYALIISGYTIQWFSDAMTGGYTLIDALKPTGLLILSFPGSKSFFQWKSACEELDIPFTGNALPELDRLGVQFSMKPVLIDTFDEIYPERYDSALGFFKTLKNTGEAVKINKDKRLSVGQMRALMAQIDSKSQSVIEMGYHLVYMAARKNEKG